MKKWEELKFVGEAEFNYIVKEYNNNDSAHGLDHIREVVNTAQIICQRMNCEYNEVIEIACLTHDMGANVNNRKFHEKVAKDKFFNLFDEILCLKITDALKIADCILEHRSSISDEERSSAESIIVAMADTGLPCFNNKELLDNLLIRSMKYHLEKTNSITLAFEEAKKHLKEKYGRNGYLKYGETYKKVFGDLLEKQFKLIDQL